jgi:hypothetical protein
VLLALSALTGLGLYARGLKTVFPNVSVGGMNLGGLTRREAELELRAADYERSGSEGIRATLTFPNGESFSVDAKDAGMRPSAARSAAMAADYGRGGSLFTAAASYLRCVFTRTELIPQGEALIDTQYVRSATDAAADRFNLALMRGAYRIEGDSIIVVKGAGGALASPDEVFELTVEALRESEMRNEPVEARYDVSRPDAGEVDLKALYRQLAREPVTAEYDPLAHTATQSVTGVSFDVTGAERMLAQAGIGAEVVIPLIYTQPEMTTERLNAMLFRDVLSERSTNVAGASNRATNIRLAAAAVNGTVLNPGDEFSFNNVVGERTEAKGYRLAGAYVGGETVQETGGGICQVSSTIYDCVLRADLEVVSRVSHMFVVTYLPYGNDATVNWGTIDFKFKNNTEYPLRIESAMEDRSLTVRLIGTKTDDGYVKTDFVTISTSGYKTIHREDPSVKPGTSVVDTAGHGGIVVETYKYRYDKSGELLEKTFVSRSSYKAHNRVVLVPVGTLETDSTPSAGSGNGDGGDSGETSEPSTPHESAETAPEPTPIISPEPARTESESSDSPSPSPSPAPSSPPGGNGEADASSAAPDAT